MSLKKEKLAILPIEDSPVFLGQALSVIADEQLVVLVEDRQPKIMTVLIRETRRQELGKEDWVILRREYPSAAGGAIVKYGYLDCWPINMPLSQTMARRLLVVGCDIHIISVEESVRLCQQLGDKKRMFVVGPPVSVVDNGHNFPVVVFPRDKK